MIARFEFDLAPERQILVNDAVCVEQTLYQSSSFLLNDSIIRVGMNHLKDVQDLNLVISNAFEERTL